MEKGQRYDKKNNEKLTQLSNWVSHNLFLKNIYNFKNIQSKKPHSNNYISIKENQLKIPYLFSNLVSFLNYEKHALDFGKEEY
jgi:hypothetical protein